MEREGVSRPETYTEIIQFLFRGKWRVAVLQELLRGPARLSQLMRALPNCRKKVLIDTLRSFEHAGWIARRDLSTKTRKVEYVLLDEPEEVLRRIVSSISAEQAS